MTLIALLEIARAGTLMLTTSAPDLTDPIPLSSMEVKSEYALTPPTYGPGPLSVATVQVTRDPDAFSLDLMFAQLEQVTLGVTTLTWVPDSGSTQVLSMTNATVLSIATVETDDGRKAEQLELEGLGLTWTTLP